MSAGAGVTSHNLSAKGSNKSANIGGSAKSPGKKGQHGIGSGPTSSQFKFGGADKSKQDASSAAGGNKSPKEGSGALIGSKPHSDMMLSEEMVNYGNVMPPPPSKPTEEDKPKLVFPNGKGTLEFDEFIKII